MLRPHLQILNLSETVPETNTLAYSYRELKIKSSINFVFAVMLFYFFGLKVCNLFPTSFSITCTEKSTFDFIKCNLNPADT